MFFSEYHSSLISELRAEGAGAGEALVDDVDRHLLLGAVAEELAADHLDVLGGLVLAGLWKVSVAQCMPMKPLPPWTASKKAL